jgi:iron complex transport system substrate-binding protein
MTSRTRSARRAVAVLATVTSLTVVTGSCGDADPASQAAGQAVTDPASASPATSYPLTVDNCGTEVVLDAAPERVVLLEAAAVSILDAAGALDRVAARVGEVPTEYYGDDVNAAVEEIPALTSETGPTGGVEISLEAVIAVDPDLVIGYETETLSRDALADVGIPLYVMPPYCDSPPEPDFDSVYDEVERYGQMFDTADVASESAAGLRERVEARRLQPAGQGTTAAALYVTTGGGPLYAYSSLGMVDAQLAALGLTNVFADLGERVPEISREELIAREPDVLILLHTEPDATQDQLIELVAGLPGAETIPAVEQGRVFPVLFNYSEPPSPLVVDGLEVVADLVAQ